MPGAKTNERPGTRAVLRHSRIAPNKVREVLDLIRNKPVQEAEAILRFSERDAATVVGKVLHSAIANAENNDDQEAEELYVSACFADEGTTIKRWRPRARGRATRIRKRTSHITVIVSRMPSAQLERIRARRRAEQLAQRARRVAGARKAEGDTRSRAERRAGVEPETPEPEVSDTGASDTEALDNGAADTEVLEPEAPDTGVSDAEVLEPEAPDTGVSDTEAPDPEAVRAEEPTGTEPADLEATGASGGQAAATDTAGDDAGEEQ